MSEHSTHRGEVQEKSAGRTPGPWHVETLGDGLFIVSGPTSQHITDFITTQANAHLIAAAPELLAALKSAMVILEAANSKCTQDTALIAACRAALLKAGVTQ